MPLLDKSRHKFLQCLRYSRRHEPLGLASQVCLRAPVGAPPEEAFSSSENPTGSKNGKKAEEEGTVWYLVDWEIDEGHWSLARSYLQNHGHFFMKGDYVIKLFILTWSPDTLNDQVFKHQKAEVDESGDPRQACIMASLRVRYSVVALRW
ncbi:hypothetical protein SELMODRAFT_413773 [Selaginella moellendorffii]|uniref:Uncharacterized protein n=1 Tax=Selaginella moellendorffii TaxID=88036 RepID=D8RQ65_SELML|nr:hypothetical protein SELMODRAFT_413773 [Selaginella moellendorffii]